jgi:hypothetical protein
MGYSIDTLPNSTFINEFAAQFDQIPIGFVKQCDDCFKGNESKEFYKGLLTGFANAHNLVRQVDPNSNSINSLGMILCYVSKKYLDL